MKKGCFRKINYHRNRNKDEQDRQDHMQLGSDKDKD